jgi:hypothetical protein
MSEIGQEDPKKADGLNWKVVLGLGASIAFFTYLMVSGNEIDESQKISAFGSKNCLNASGLNKLSSDEFEEQCEDKYFEVTVFPKDCNVSSDCELSVFDPELPGFDRDTLFEADLQRSLSYSDEKLRVKGVVSGRGFMGQVEVDVYEQEVVPLTSTEVADREKARQPKVDPIVEANRQLVQERAAENKRMMQYAEANDRELSLKSTQVKIDQDSVNGMAEYRYYLKSGVIVSCLRGYSADVFVYECKEHRFN